MKKELQDKLKKQHYSLIGENSAVQICKYTKESIRNKDVCYKQKFYGIQSHRCVQMSPIVMSCEHRCLHCWRPIEFTENSKKFDDPKYIVDKAIEAQRKMLSGFLGSKGSDKSKFFEAQDPRHFAISLSGEPTLYPYLSELIKELDKRRITSFVVTNGENPDVLKKISPTQLYISLNAPNEEIFNKLAKPVEGGWKNILKTLELLSKLKTRTVIRITLIKGMNMINEEEYSDLIKKANPMFIELKAYMHIGFSQYRLKKENMPSHYEVKEFAKKISKLTGYKILDEKENSRVVLLGKSGRNRFIKF